MIGGDYAGLTCCGWDVSSCPESRNQAAVALSKLGASKGGLARAAALSPAKRKAIAKKAVAARWAKKR